ncbi:MAG TPA: DinB family protein [Chryseosolibacter sp.]|nr:DinB family protein [Chryseosolibacter sp.]
MTQLEALRKELENEAITTRKMLSRVPADKFDWQPHPKSMTLKTLATHVAELPTWIGMALNTDELDFESNPYSPADLKTTQDLLDHFEKSLEDGRKHINAGREEVLDKPWTLRSGKTIFSVDPKRDVLRMTFSQIIHHRAQLGVYLRLLNIPIPGSYGPSADEQ